MRLGILATAGASDVVNEASRNYNLAVTVIKILNVGNATFNMLTN